MESITPRQKQILEEVVQEYIKRACPISSQFLKKKCCLKVSPSTIRLDFAELSRKGFLTKDYISGGRIPTDRGYRFFVDNIFQERENSLLEKEVLYCFRKILKDVSDTLCLYRHLVKVVAEYSSNLAMAYLSEKGIFWKEGWSKLFQAPEFHHSDYLIGFSQLVEELETNFDKIIKDNQNDIKVYIGKELPLASKDFSLVLGAVQTKRKKTNSFAILGPKRMDFKKNITLMKSLIELIKERQI